MQAQAPGKLILSGEHAVVYGKPAIAVAVDRQATAAVTSINTSDTVSLTLPRYGIAATFSPSQLREQTQALWQRQRLAQAGRLSTTEVVTDPVQPLQAAVIHAMEGFNPMDSPTARPGLNARPSAGFAVRLDSDIPPGCGLGSSAATSLSVLRAVTGYLGRKMEQGWYERAAGQIEELHHGRPSGVDATTCARGGCLRFHNGLASPLPPPVFPLRLVHTGTPATNTAACVFHVKRHAGNGNLWDAFEQVTRATERALLRRDMVACRQAVRRNHRLLVEIGVVPARVQEFIAAVERQGGAAKICGAGAVTGDSAGVVWVVADPFPTPLCRQYGYAIMTVRARADALKKT
ncbi:MAG: hypothetical protein AAF471_06445 [Myxococcota bacterium]